MKDYRIAKTPAELQKLLDNITAASLSDQDVFNRYINKKITFEEFSQKNGYKILFSLGYFIVDTPSTSAIIGSYADLGIIVEPVVGNAWHTKTMVAINYDNVQYAIDDRAEYLLDTDKSVIEKRIKDFNLLKMYYHSRIKRIYDYLVTRTADDVWVLVGGGSQLTAFFGNKHGYIAILYLDDPEYMNPDIIDVRKTEKIKSKKYTLAIQFSRNNHYFDDCLIKNLKIEKSDCDG
jgi:hypothetical protein